jgi:hypothetical protein
MFGPAFQVNTILGLIIKKKQSLLSGTAIANSNVL